MAPILDTLHALPLEFCNCLILRLRLRCSARVSDWPTPESVKQEMLDREREERVRRKYRFAYSSEEAIKLLESKVNAAAQDAQRRWYRR